MKKLFPILLALLVLMGCAHTKPGETTPAETPPAATKPTTAPTTEPTTAPTTEPTTAPTTEPTTAPTTEPPTEPTTPPEYLGNFTHEDVLFFDELFRQPFVPGEPSPVNYYNRIMHIHDFTDPRQIDVRQVFYDQDIDENWELTEAEKAFLSKQEKIDLGLDVVRVSSEKVESVLQECFGLSLKDMQESDAWVYFPDTDCYYHSKGDTHMIGFKIQGGTWLEDGKVEIYYYVLGTIDQTITLQKTDSGYRIVANIFNGFLPQGS